MIPNCLKKEGIPHKPGVYIYKDKAGSILYVGKAIDLYHRVASYFCRNQPDPKTRNLVENISSLETIVVTSELEALLLEANLIKKYLPSYNIRLTDDKDYLYIKITKEDFPKVVVARKKELGDAKEFFGPFPSSNTVRTTLKRIRRIFPWCTTPYGIHGRPCFYFHLKLCHGVCAGKIDRKGYNKIINRLIRFLRGEKENLLAELTKEMEQYSKDLRFEEAAALKRTIDGLLYITQENRTSSYLQNPNFLEDQNKLAVLQVKNDLNLSQSPQRIECFDISNLGGKLAVGSLVVLTDGDTDKKWYRKFKINPPSGGSEKSNDTAMMAEVLRRRIMHDEWPKPDLILVDGGKGQLNAAGAEMSMAGWTVPVFGLAKRMEWLYGADGSIIKLSRSSLSLRLLQKIRDEAHRFAISYHKKLREKQFLNPV